MTHAQKSRDIFWKPCATWAAANSKVSDVYRDRAIRDGRPVRSSIEKARRVGVRVYPAALCYLTPPQRSGVLLGYGTLTEREIGEGIRRLAAVLGLGSEQPSSPPLLVRSPLMARYKSPPPVTR